MPEVPSGSARRDATASTRDKGSRDTVGVSRLRCHLSFVVALPGTGLQLVTRARHWSVSNQVKPYPPRARPGTDATCEVNRWVAW